MNGNVKRLVIFAILVASTAFCHAQAYQVRGTLRDAESGEPMEFTNCVLLRADDSVFVAGCATNEHGDLRFAAIDAGGYLLRVTAIGYETYYRRLNLPLDTALGTIRLSHGTTTLRSVSVTASRPLYSADGEKTFYHVEDDPSVQTGTMSDALQNAPGVEVDAEGNITLRGSSNVTIWLNDKPSNLSGEALKQYIKTLPASSVKRIEVLSNPSARYGSTGAIINIVTDQKVSLNQILCMGFNASTAPYIQPWASYVYANDKVSVTAWLNGTIGNYSVKESEEQLRYDTNGLLSTEHRYSSSEKQHFRQGLAGLQVMWNIDSVTNLTMWGGGYPGFYSMESQYDVSWTEHIYNPGDYSYHADSYSPNHYAGAYGGLWLQRKLDSLGQKISLSLNSNYNSQQQKYDRQRIYNVQHQMDVHNITDNRSSSLWSNMSVDYTKPYSKKGEIEAGLSAQLGNNSSHVVWDTLDHADSLMRRDAFRTYNLRTADKELSAYTTVQHRIGKLTLKGGIRVYRKWKQAIYTDLPEATSQHDVDKAYWDLMPSLHASYSTQSGHNFTLSYTRRFSSPGSSIMSTYTVLGEESYEIGNPDLRFSHTHNLEGGWAFYKKWGSLGITGYLRANTDEIQQLYDVAYHPYFGHIVSYSTWANIGVSRAAGAEANITWRPIPFMNVRVYADIYDYYYRMEFRPGQWDERHLPTISGRLNVWGKVWKVLQVYANAHYSTAKLSLLSESKPDFQLDLGMSADLLNRRLSLFVNAGDILATKQFGSNSLNPYYHADNSQTYNSRSLNLGLTWRIGKLELESRAKQGVEAPTI